jgi:hypothetical protein
MAYAPRMRSPRDSGRGHGKPRREKVKARAERRKHRSSDLYTLQENHAATSEDVLERTLGRLRNLGKQVFALSPFSGHFDRWLMDVRVVLSEFESSPKISLDGQFVEERSRIFSKVEVELDERRRGEASVDEPFRNLSNSRIVLERMEKEYASATRKIEARRDSEIKRLSSIVDSLREEVDSVARMKTGIFRGISERVKAQRHADATQRLKSAEAELALAVQEFAGEQEKLRDRCERMKHEVIEQMRAEQREIDDQEIDGSLEARGAACEALISAVNALVERKGLHD